MSNTLRKLQRNTDKTMKKPKIILGIPANRPIPKEVVASLLPLANRVGVENVIMMQNGMINQCRDGIVLEAINRKADYIFWMDDDMIIPPDAIDKLLAHNKDICSGLYFGRGNCKPLLYNIAVDRDENNLIKSFSTTQILDYPQNSLIKVGAVGFGCVLTKVSVLRGMLKEWGTCFDFIQGKGEDFSFGLRCEDMGIETWVDTSVKCGHIGQITVTEKFWDQIKDSSK